MVTRFPAPDGKRAGAKMADTDLAVGCSSRDRPRDHHPNRLKGGPP